VAGEVERVFVRVWRGEDGRGAGRVGVMGRGGVVVSWTCGWAWCCPWRVVLFSRVQLCGYAVFPGKWFGFGVGCGLDIDPPYMGQCFAEEAQVFVSICGKEARFCHYLWHRVSLYVSGEGGMGRFFVSIFGNLEKEYPSQARFCQQLCQKWDVISRFYQQLCQKLVFCSC